MVVRCRTMGARGNCTPLHQRGQRAGEHMGNKHTVRHRLLTLSEQLPQEDIFSIASVFDDDARDGRLCVPPIHSTDAAGLSRGPGKATAPHAARGLLDWESVSSWASSSSGSIHTIGPSTPRCVAGTAKEQMRRLRRQCYRHTAVTRAVRALSSPTLQQTHGRAAQKGHAQDRQSQPSDNAKSLSVAAPVLLVARPSLNKGAALWRAQGTEEVLW